MKQLFKSKFLQEGGAIDTTTAPAAEPVAPEAAPAPEGRQGGGIEEVVMQIVQMAQQDPQAAAQAALEFVMVLAQQMGLVGQPAGAPAAPEGQPVFRKGGKLKGYMKGGKSAKKEDMPEIDAKKAKNYKK